MLILKALSNIVADDFFFIIISFQRKKKSWHLLCIVWLAEDSHEMSSLILLKNTNKKSKWR